MLGSGNNRALELFNPTTDTIDLSNYQIGRFRDGAGTPMLLQLSGYIGPLETYVIAHDKRDPNGTGFEEPISPLLEALADTFVNPVFVQSNSPFYFNGDDAIILASGWVIIDLIGKIGEDPGTAWSDANGVWWTRDHTLVRKQTVMSGDTDGLNDFYPEIEWDSLPQNTFSHLGWHDCDCATWCATYSYTIDTISCVGLYLWNGTTYDQSGTYTHQTTNVQGCDSIATLDLTILTNVPYPEQLCLVTVDSTSGYNLIQWQKTDNEKTDYYIVMKENSQTSQFDSIGWVAFDSLSVFTDYNSNPNQTSDRYGLVTVDSCGNIGSFSNTHRTIHLLANQGINGEVNLNWNAYEGFTYSNFEIYRSNNAGPFNLIGTTSNSNFSYSDLAPPSGTNYYRVAVVNPNGCTPTRSVSRSISNIINSSGTTVGIEDQNISPVVSIYPNPSNGNFAVAIEGIEGIIGLSVFDARGREVLATSLVGNGQKTIQNIDLSNYANGVYTISIRTAKGTASQKLVKE